MPNRMGAIVRGTADAPLWTSPQLPRHDEDDDWPEAVVVLSLHPERAEGAQIVVRPSRAYLRRGRRLLFIVNAAPDDEVVIKFKLDDDCPSDAARAGDHPWIVDPVNGARGPFPHQPVGEDYAPLNYSGRYERGGPCEILTEPARRRGFFSFDVWWRRGDNEYGRDPAVIVFDHAGVSL